LGVFEEKKPSDTSDDESDIEESDIIINPFAATVTDKNPGITLLDQDESEDDDNSSSSEENEESSS
jgi:hypothetical protein